MKNRIGWKWLLIALICGAFFLSGCQALGNALGNTEVPKHGEIFLLLEDQEEPGVSGVEPQSSMPAGSLRLADGAAALIYEYLGTYYESLATLEPGELLGFYESSLPEAVESGEKNQAVLAYMTGLRKIQPMDLRMGDYRVYLQVLEIVQDAETPDTLSLFIREHHQVQFRFMKGQPSFSAGILHRFRMKHTDRDGWRLLEHHKDEDMDYLLEETKERLELSRWSEVSEYLLVRAGIAREERESQALLDAGSKVDEGTDTGMSGSATSGGQYARKAEMPYQRAEAVSYAKKWVDPTKVVRNPEWLAYDERGGNCNNYVSQALLASGIPMDTKGHIDAQWKWFGDGISTRQTKWGRSPSWTGVNEFYKYVVSNRGFGLAATPGAPFAMAEEGDVVLYGTDDSLKHAVLITGIVRDEEGRVVDYLIHSNTTDRIDYPLSAYSYYRTTLIKIWGWNTR